MSFERIFVDFGAKLDWENVRAPHQSANVRQIMIRLAKYLSFVS